MNELLGTYSILISVLKDGSSCARNHLIFLGKYFLSKYSRKVSEYFPNETPKGLVCILGGKNYFGLSFSPNL